MLISKMQWKSAFYSWYALNGMWLFRLCWKTYCTHLNFPIFVLGTEQIGFELVEKLFQGQLVLRTRCLECESLTERREDFQDISVPVQEDELSKVDESSESKQNWSLVRTME